MPTEHFEFAIVGGGKGGKTLAAKMASAGRSVVMIEKGMIGGSCINVACIPTKTMVKSAKVAELARRAAGFGILVAFDGADPAGIRARRNAVVAEMVERNQANFHRSGMTLLIGTARFAGLRALEVRLRDGGMREVTADKVFVNTGTRPALPPLPGLVEARPLNSETVQELDHLPEHLVVLGGGYIGCEFAQMFRRFGSRVTILERSEAFLPREDPDVGEQVLSIFREDGIDVRLGASVQSIEGRSGQSIRVRLQTRTGQQVVEGTDLLAALGRVPNTEDLNSSAAGIELDSRGFVKVNDRLETTAEGVWALGDVNGGPQFTHSSLDDYRIVAANLSGGNRSTADRVIPYTLFIDPELGRVGITEAQARREGRQVRVARLPAAAIPRAVTSGETRGYLKVVVDADTDQILGAAILTAEGGEVMAVVQVAMRAGLPSAALRDMIFAHPTMSEGLNDLFAWMEYRVPIELRVFLTAAVIIDDIVAILVIAMFYTGAIYAGYLIAGGAVTALVVWLNRADVYGTLPYAICGVVLWFFLHEAGLHATLAGVILAMLIPTRPPANLNALLAQAATVIHLEDSHTGEAMRPGPSEPALRTLDAIHERIESPADKLLRSVEPWSSYVVLPIFALANAGVAWSLGVFEGHGRLICAITLGLVIGKPVGIVLAAWLAVRSGVAAKPDAYSWRQLCGAGALGGIGFTMSLFIAGVAFPDPADYAAAKIAIFLASLIAAGLGVLILWPRPEVNDERGTAGRFD